LWPLKFRQAKIIRVRKQDESDFGDSLLKNIRISASKFGMSLAGKFPRQEG